MSMTTVIVEDEVFQTYKAGFKADAGGANAGPKLAYMILGMTPDFKRIALLKTVARDQNPSYDDFVNEFPAKEPRWAVYFFEFEKEDGGGKREKICYFSWAPDDAPIKLRMVHATSNQAVLDKLAGGIHVQVQGTEHADFAYAEVFKKASKGA